MTTATESPSFSRMQAMSLAARNGDQRAYAEATHNIIYEPYQDLWVQALQTRHRIVIVCPPDTFKSTTVRHFVERSIGHDRNIRILWLMNSGVQAEKQVMTVASTIKSNNIYRRAFPHVYEDEDAQWTKSVLFVERDEVGPDPTLMATGFNGPYQGLHFHVIVIDDPTNQEDVRSPVTMEMQRQKIRGVILDRLMEGGRIVVILTRWGDNDLVPTFASMGFDIFEMPILGKLYPWGQTLSPTRFPPHRVRAIHRDKGDALFSLTYMCNPKAVEGGIVKRAHIGYWDNSIIPELGHMVFFVGIDPAATTNTWSDYSSIATVGFDYKTRKMYLMPNLFAARLEVPDLREEIVKRCKRQAGLRGVGLETVGFQTSLMQDLKRQCKLPYKEIPYRSRRTVMHRIAAIERDKVGRALYLDSLLSSGRLLLPRDLPLLDGVSLESELCTMGMPGGHDDRGDSIAFACVLAEASTPPRVKVEMGAY